MFSFTGAKDSFAGEHNFYGPSALRFYTRVKTVTARWPGEAGAGGEAPSAAAGLAFNSKA